MASSESYLQFILGQLGGLEGITSRKMMESTFYISVEKGLAVSMTTAYW